MNNFILSRNLFGVIGYTFIIIRVYFTIRTRNTRSSGPKEKVPASREGKLNFTLRRFVILPLIIVTICLYYSVKPFWMRFFILSLPEAILWIGTVFGLIGNAFLLLVHLYLGKEWSANLQLREHRTLIKSGPYSKIRHPMYTSLFIIYLSLALVSDNIIIIILTILAIISLVVRLPEEEELLISQFGNEYKDYMQNTSRFFPKLK
jgi:protein-S-isoprenylcysteine O-methyltransferase Ste14